ncbi:TPA: hypothetical protein ACVU5H_001651 [Vibrio parahaemolyticus]
MTQCRARDLISPNRLDLGFKLLYIEAMSDHSPEKIEAYEQHVEAITEGTCKERGNDKKDSIEEFKKQFKDIYISIKENGFDDNISKIPIASDGSILDGAHRTSVLIYMNQEVTVHYSDVQKKDYNHEYFRQRGVSEDYIKLALKVLMKYSDKIRLACLWPIQSEKIDKLISHIEAGNIFYSCDESLEINGVKNLVTTFYSGEKWLGEACNNFNGAMGKALPCYRSNRTNFIWFRIPNDISIVEFKDNFRKSISADKHSVHMTDTPEETLDVSDSLLSPDFALIFNRLDYSFSKNLITQTSSLENSKNKIISGSAMLDILKLRKSSDVDTLIYPSQYQGEDSHNKLFVNFNRNIEDYFSSDLYVNYIFGQKFLCISEILDFKKNRGEEKDRIDIRLISSINNNSVFNKYFLLLKNKWLRIKTKIKFNIASFLRVIGLFNFIQVIRGKGK